MHHSASDIAGARVVVGIYALSVYEFLLLLDDEYRLVYKSDWSTIKTMYLISRAMTLGLWPVVIFVHTTGHDKNACSIWARPQGMIYLVLQILPHCLLLVRTWVFSGRKKLLAWLFSIALLAFTVASIWVNTVFWILTEPRHHQQCSTLLPGARHKLGLVLYGAIGLDVTAAAIVIYYYVRDPHIRGRLGRLCFIQAITYVFIMLIINGYTTCADVFTPEIKSVTHPMTLIVPNLLACRFILELRLETNPTATQLFSRLSAVVHEGIEVSIDQEGI